MGTKSWVVYLLRCSDNSLYCGISNDVARRVGTHNAGKGAKYTKPRRPVELVTTSRAMTRGDALKLEYRIRRLPADQKIIALEKWGSDIESGD
jgi:putative endonuclease